MRPVLLLLLSCATLVGAADKQTIFQVEGMECASCVYMVQLAVNEAKGVKEAAVDQGFLGGTAKVRYDPKQVSEHQIAQAVRYAVQLHGMPYLATLQIHVEGYSNKDNAAKIKSHFAKWSSLVDLVILDSAKGQLLIRFKPLEADATGAVPSGWALHQLTDVLDNLKLRFEIVEPRPL